jgi:two-component system response regulator AtoC/two-component system response regulator HupR/HoxA
LQVLRIDLPPLRRRRSDIKRLAEHFLDLFCREFDSRVEGVSGEVLPLLKQYHWPGNLRELKNVIAQGAILADRGKIEPKHLPSRIAHPVEQDAAVHGLGQAVGSAGPCPPVAQGGDLSSTSPGVSLPAVDGVFMPVGFALDEVERAYVLKTLAACGNNKTRTAKVLGISRKALYDKLERWGLLE